MPAPDAVGLLTSALDGRYTIEREIGAGGMATVYLARDVKHNRNVALKVLKPELGAILGVERFLAEIQVTANLQHPNLLPLFDSGEANGLLFYVMPYVEGETLRARLNREKQLPVDDAVHIAVAVASALEYAHAHDVIHRDLKPENILMQAGQPVIADFGIALAVSKAGGARITQTGLSLGTPQYMSPEQATGDRTVDARTDIYSLGAVTYEMLAGEPPHAGPTAQSIIAKLMTEEVRPLTILRRSVPPHVDAAVRHALEKLPADRFATAQAFADAISGKSIATLSASGAPALTSRADGAASRRARARLAVRETVMAALLVVAIGFGLAEWKRANRPDDSTVLRFQLVLPKEQLFNDALGGTLLAISPRGDRIAYVANTPTSSGSVLWLRSAEEIGVKQLLNRGDAIRTPCFSPDGMWVAFTAGNEVRKVSVEGGPVATLATLPDLPLGLTWGPNGFLVAGSSAAGLFVIPERGGPARLLPKAEGVGSDRYPVFLPDGKTVVYVSVPSGGFANARLAFASVADGKRVITDVAGSAPLAALNGQLVYATLAGAVMAVPIDGDHVTVNSPVPLVQDVVVDPNGGAKAAVSASGTLVYRSGRSENQPMIVRGGATPLIAELRDYSSPRFSPDGKRVALTISRPEGPDVWVYDRAQNTLTKVTSEGSNQRPEWSHDGKRLLFASARGGQSAFWWQPADGSGAAELLYKPVEGDPYEAVLSPDGHWLVYRTGPGGKPSRSIFAVELVGEHKSVPLVTGNSSLTPRLSPDGHWLAYQSNESGTFEIYVRPFPGPGGKVQVSSGLGTEPLWAASGRMLYYRSGRDVVGVSVTTGASLTLGERKVVLTGDFLQNPSHPNYDVSPDGSEFLMIRRAGEDVLTIVVHNWAREVAAKTTGQGGR